MFHTYVTASCGTRVDIDRARWEMDQDLFHQIHRTAILSASGGRFCRFDLAMYERMCGEPLSQTVWRGYCKKHQQKYGTPFRPDVDPTWDHS